MEVDTQKPTQAIKRLVKQSNNNKRLQSIGKHYLKLLTLCKVIYFTTIHITSLNKSRSQVGQIRILRPCT